MHHRSSLASLIVSLRRRGCVPPWTKPQVASGIPPYLLFWIVVALAALVSGGRDAHADDALVVLRGETMGTTYTVKLEPRSSGSRSRFRRIVEHELDLVDKLMSTYLQDSELSRFNRAEEDKWFDVSPAMAEVVGEAREISRLSGGAFDVTVAPLVKLWRFGAGAPAFGDLEPGALPSDALLAKVRSTVGYRFLDVRRSPPALRKRRPGLTIDLSAIAKGYGVDRVAEALEADGIANYMIEVGGEVRTKGVRPDGKRWVIGIEAPLDRARMLYGSIALADRALATSGDYRQFYVVDGRRYSHTIDPRTGRPIRHDLASVSVIAPSCMRADGLATALNVLGPREGFALADREGIAAYFLVREGDGYSALATSTFPKVDRVQEGPTRPVPARQGTRPDHAFSAPTLFFVTLAFFLLAITGMAAGVILGKRRLSGSCGGLANLRDEHGTIRCEICTTPAEDCPRKKKQKGASPS